MKNAYDVYETSSGWKVKIYDHGFVTMCELDDQGRWKDSTFPTKAEAERAAEWYNLCWKD